MSFETRIALLESQQQQDALTRRMTEGLAYVVKGGVEGIQEIAQTAPETILLAFTQLGEVISVLQEENTQHLEARLEMLDALESIDFTPK